MKKVKALITLIIIVLLIAGGSYLVFNGAGKNKTGAVTEIKQGLDLAGGVSITYRVVGDETPSATDMQDTKYKLQQRVDSYSTEAQVYTEGDNRINIEIPGVTDAEAILEELGRPGSLYFITQYSPDGEANYTQEIVADEETGAYTYEYKLKRELADIIADGSAVLSGTDVESASAKTSTDEYGRPRYIVELVFNDKGTDIFADATTKAYKSGDSIGIYYDGEFISVPTVDEPITGGIGYISGQTSFAEAKKLASNIRIGGLKLELEELYSKVVGPQLGHEAIKTSVMAGIIGLIIVMLFMIVVYRIPGLASAISLVIYTLLVLLTINVFEITLTLPGIAGIILSIGMAVDANVIIFARVREEIALGKTVNSAIQIGFKKALSAIVDGNVTTLIAALVLIFMGTGSVKGFAQTLAIGIVLSMFTALVITKLIVNALFGIGLQDEKLYGVAKERKSINFLAKKNLFFCASILVIVVGIASMFVYKNVKGSSLNYSLEFAGGTATTVTMNEEYSLERINKEVVPVVEEVIGAGDVQAQAVKDTNKIIIKTKTLDEDARNLLNSKLTESFSLTEEIEQETISATISNEMRKNAIVSVIVATICMLIYIWFRFRDIRFATSAVVALLHDVLIVLAFYALFRISVGNTFIACMLTIVGYSINATIVIFDRIRENLAEMAKKETLADVVNKSITQTLTRSIYTSITTIVMVAVLFILGVSSIKLFALPLMVGFVCGAYSSVCLTGALWYIMRMKWQKKED